MAHHARARLAQFSRVHNAMWPGLVGKGPDSEPPIDLETMLRLTAAAECGGARFDGVDLFLSTRTFPLTRTTMIWRGSPTGCAHWASWWDR